MKNIILSLKISVVLSVLGFSINSYAKSSESVSIPVVVRVKLISPDSNIINEVSEGNYSGTIINNSDSPMEIFALGGDKVYPKYRKIEPKSRQVFKFIGSDSEQMKLYSKINNEMKELKKYSDL